MTDRPDLRLGPRRTLPPVLPAMALRRAGMILAVSGTAGLGAILMLGIMAGDGLTLLEVGILVLFVPSFAWISLAFWNGIVGFALQLLRRDPLTLKRVSGGEAAAVDGPLRSRIALVMPAYNEDPERVVAGLLSSLEAADSTGHGEAFEAFLLSDTSDPAIARREEELVAGLPIRYRRRPANTGRKAGNIADFCDRWGAGYDFMVVLDADSLMAGGTLVELVRRMEANPAVGLIQTVPIPARQETPLGRFVQFAAALYSPMLAAGQAFWQGDAGNYWGHNAILRVEPFSRDGRLPVLKGSPPLGGEVLSHDFVEAALLRRAGWHVVLAADLTGSWEEVPGNLVDFAVRERRWAQGSLQHLRLLGSRGFHPVSRLHLLLGAVNYLASTLWLLLLLLGSVYVLVPGGHGPVVIETLPGSGLAGEIRDRPAGGWLSLLGATALILFLPKALGVILALLRRRREFGGAVRLAAGALAETLHSIILAPVMMLWHTAFVGGVLAGRNVTWGPQLREGRAVGWGEAFRRSGWMSAVGVVWTAAIGVVAPVFLLWMSPILVGLVAAPALVRMSGITHWGKRLRSLGLLHTPSERTPPPEHQLRKLPPPSHRPPPSIGSDLRVQPGRCHIPVHTP